MVEITKTPETLRLEKRANKNAWITAVLTWWFPPLGYVYTMRYRAVIIVFFLSLPIYHLTGNRGARQQVLRNFFLVSVAIENIISVKMARDKLAYAQSLSNFETFTPTTGNEPIITTRTNHRQENVAPTPQNNRPEMVILKAIDSRGEMTISDIVINTELSPALVKETLLYLEREQLIYGYNRETDGAIVYKNI